jgi:hypothetical protein
MHIASIGIDLGKTTFHLVALGEQAASSADGVDSIHSSLLVQRRRPSPVEDNANVRVANRGIGERGRSRRVCRLELIKCDKTVVDFVRPLG